MTLRKLLATGAIAAAILIVAGCGGDDSGAGGDDRRRRIQHGRAPTSPLRPRASGTRVASTSRSASPAPAAGFERFCRGETDLSNASRPIKDEESAICDSNGVEYVELQVANDALTDRRQQREPLGNLPHGRRAERDPGSRAQGEQLEPCPRGVPERAAEALRRRHGLRHVRLLHRCHQRRGGRQSHRLLGERGRNVTVQGVSGSEGRPSGLLRLLVFRGEPGLARGARDRRRVQAVSRPVSRAPRPATTSPFRDRCSSMSRRSRSGGRGGRLPDLHARQRDHDLPSRRSSCPLNEDQLAEARQKLEDALA